MSDLTDLGLMRKPALCELLNESIPFLVHPSLWIRQAVAGLISSAGNSLSILDVQCKIMPELKPYMNHSLIQIEKYDILFLKQGDILEIIYFEIKTVVSHKLFFIKIPRFRG